jgi:hypothetical protein
MTAKMKTCVLKTSHQQNKKNIYKNVNKYDVPRHGILSSSYKSNLATYFLSDDWMNSIYKIRDVHCRRRSNLSDQGIRSEEKKENRNITKLQDSKYA